MEERVNRFKTNFTNIMNINTTVINIFEILQLRINRLKLYYVDFIKDNNNRLYVFGLDSLRFQSKIIDIEYDDMKRLYLAINNRMYCEYFKLYNIIVEYIQKVLKDKKVMESVKPHNFPIYKDLEPFKEYDIEIIIEVHDSILLLVNALIHYISARDYELTLHKNKNNLGLNIDNFITSFNYEVLIKREKIQMFLSYIEFFHRLHSKYLKRFSNKVQLMYTHISSDINFEENIQIQRNNDESSIEPRNNSDSGIDSGTSTPSKMTQKEKIESSIKKISSLLQLGTRCKSDSIISYEDKLHNAISDHFENINKSCDNIIHGDVKEDYTNAPSIDVENIAEEQNSPLNNNLI
jgi:hypothetical protein